MGNNYVSRRKSMNVNETGGFSISGFLSYSIIKENKFREPLNWAKLYQLLKFRQDNREEEQQRSFKKYNSTPVRKAASSETHSHKMKYFFYITLSKNQ